MTDWLPVLGPASLGLSMGISTALSALPYTADRPRSGFLLTLTSALLPYSMRAEWLEEQSGYLHDLPGRRARLAWVWQTFLSMPRYAYTVRTGAKKESA